MTIQFNDTCKKVSTDPAGDPAAIQPLLPRFSRFSRFSRFALLRNDSSVVTNAVTFTGWVFPRLYTRGAGAAPLRLGLAVSIAATVPRTWAGKGQGKTHREKRSLFIARKGNTRVTVALTRLHVITATMSVVSLDVETHDVVYEGEVPAQLRPARPLEDFHRLPLRRSRGGDRG